MTEDERPVTSLEILIPGAWADPAAQRSSHPCSARPTKCFALECSQKPRMWFGSRSNNNLKLKWSISKSFYFLCSRRQPAWPTSGSRCVAGLWVLCTRDRNTVMWNANMTYCLESCQHQHLCQTDFPHTKLSAWASRVSENTEDLN